MISKIIFLKDVLYKKTDKGVQLHKFSDYYGNKIELIRLLCFKKADYFEFRTNNFDRLRWGILYLLFLTINPSKEKKIIDSKGELKINYIFLLIKTFISAYSFLLQLLSLIPYFILIIFYILIPKTKVKNKKIKSVIFLRTNLVFNLTAGGALGHILGVVNGFINNNINVSFLGIDKILGIDDNIKSNIIYPRKSLFLFPVFSGIETSVRTLFFIFNNNFIKKKENVAIYYRISSFDISPLILKLIYNTPLIIEFNSFLAWEEKNNGHKYSLKTIFISFIENLILKNADLIVCVSEILKTQLLNKGFKSDKIMFCSNGVDINKFKPLTNKHKFINEYQLKKNKTIGFVGTFGPWHGIDLLCDTIEEFNKNSISSKVKFILVGDGALRNFAMKKLKKYKNVIFTGKVKYEEIVEYLNICDILISPHKITKSDNVFIGSPTKIFEYLAMQKIVIGTDCGQIKQILNPYIDFTDLNKNHKITKKEVAILANQSSSSLTESIKYAINNYEKLKFLGANSLKKVKLMYTWDKKVLDIINSFNEKS